MIVSKKRWVNDGAVTLTEVVPARVAQLANIAASYSRQDIGPVIRLLYPELIRRLNIAGIHPAGGLVIVHYGDPPELSDAVIVHTAVPVATATRPCRGFAVADLPEMRRAATITHHGPAEQVLESLRVLAGWIEDNGYRAVGYHRELYLGNPADEADQNVTEIQVSIQRR